ncbi:Uu.00g133330.m01.CDS01 [Anthostomella pinea]|uniref:Uu.00g133330.m01.CDS01 n=1 Tax=Anthostomella pinea TaxID=933095 RepID=A0AAI8VT22_9PEZI|nr:Uu.00g133330.m01.CDS01 [Anthostomella pinea]
MPTSLDSSRPIMAPSLVSPRASLRYSTYSTAPSFTPTVQSTDSAHAEIRDIETGLARMENKALSQQRVMLSEEKAGNLNKLALGAKLDRALNRRMSSQDAVMRPREKSLSEKEKA